MRKILIITAALFSGLGLQADEPKSSYSVTTDFTYASDYVFRGVKQSDESIQPSITVAAQDFTFGVWTAQGVKNRSAAWAQGNEVDLFGSYSYALKNDYSLSAGVTAYLYPSARPSMGELDKTVEGSLGISGPVGPLSGSATYFHDFDLDSDTFEASLTYSKELPEANGTLEVGGTYGNAGYDAGDSYSYYLLKATMSFKLTSAATLKVGAYWSDSDIFGADSNTWFTIGVTTGL